MTKVQCNFRFAETMAAILDEIGEQGENRTAFLENAFAHFLRDGLKTKVTKAALAAAGRDFPEGIFRLWLEENKKQKADDLLKMATPVLESMLTVTIFSADQRQLIQKELDRRQAND